MNEEQIETTQTEEQNSSQLTQERIDSILSATGITFNAKNRAVFRGESMSDSMADGFLQPYNVTVAELRTAIAELNKKKKILDIPDDLRFRDTLTNMEVISPAFTTDSKWNKKDDELFQFFSIARPPEGGGIMLLINNMSTEYRILPLSNSSLSNLADITSTCSQMKYTNPETRVTTTLYDHITKVYEKIMKEALEAYKKMDAIDFGNWAVLHGLPSMMLNNYKLMSVQEERNIEDDEHHKTTMYRAFSLYFNESPFQCIANHYDTLAGVPSRIAKIPKLYSNDFSEPALYHIDLDSIIDYDHPHPTWDKYMKRFRPDEGKVFMAFHWATLDASNTGRQLLYIYDPFGLAGKTVMENATASALPPGMVAAIQKDSLSNQFGFEKIYDKRLVFIDDNKNPYLIRSEKMHMILGGGLGDVEPKGRKSFTFRMQCKVIASGNVPLRIDPNANHERSRVIVIRPRLTDEMIKEFAVCDKDGNLVRDKQGRPKLIGDANFEKHLIAEYRSFLADCKKAYEELCPTRSSIIISDEMEEELDNMSEDIFDIFDEQFEKKFDFGEDLKCTVTEFNKGFSRTIEAVEIAVGHSSKTTMNEDNFLQHAIKKYKLNKRTVRIGNNTYKGYVGIAPTKKNDPPNQKVPSSQIEEIVEAEGPTDDITEMLGL